MIDYSLIGAYFPKNGYGARQISDIEISVFLTTVSCERLAELEMRAVSGGDRDHREL